jgi:hypothetical protein
MNNEIENKMLTDRGLEILTILSNYEHTNEEIERNFKIGQIGVEAKYNFLRMEKFLFVSKIEELLKN